MNPYDITNIFERIASISQRATDIIFSPDHPPLMITDGQLSPIPLKELRSLTPYQVEMLGLNLLIDKPRARKTFLTTGSVETSFTIDQVGRFRVNIFRQRNMLSVVMRVVPPVIPDFADLGVPESVHSLVDEGRGLVLVTGVTGSGKSSTLAAIVNAIGAKHAYHIITVENPIEFIYPRGRSMVHQREVGNDALSESEAMIAAIRQAPQVIMVHELRNRETVELALEAAETGYLVLSSMSTPNPAETIERIDNYFPKDQEPFIRARLSEAFRCILSQKLVLKKDGSGRALATEILRPNSRTRRYVIDGPTGGDSLQEAMRDGTLDGMTTFDTELERLVKEGSIAKSANIPVTAPAKSPAKVEPPTARTPDHPTREIDMEDPDTLSEMPILGLDEK